MNMLRNKAPARSGALFCHPRASERAVRASKGSCVHTRNCTSHVKCTAVNAYQNEYLSRCEPSHFDKLALHKVEIVGDVCNFHASTFPHRQG